MQNMQNMPNISPLFFSSKDQKSKISESESSINSRTCLGHLVLFLTCPFCSPVFALSSSEMWIWRMTLNYWKIDSEDIVFTSRLQNSQEHRLLRQQHLWIPTKSGNPKGLCQPCCLHRWSTFLVVQGFGQAVLGEELGLWEARAGRCCVRQHWVCKRWRI